MSGRDNAWHPESEFKSIEEAPTKWELSMVPGGLWGEDETTSILVQHCDLRLLIADWRKRGEALEGAKYAVECMMESNSVSLAQDTIIRIKAALTQQQPPG